MQYLDLQTWPRRNHFRHFNQMDYPHFSVCANVDISSLKQFLRQSGQSFFHSMLFFVSKTANEIPEFRYRIHEEKVAVYDHVDPSFTYLAADDICNYCHAPYTDRFTDFSAGIAVALNAAQSRELLDTGPERDDLLYITSLPWISFTALMHPIQMQSPDSIPRIAWGKFDTAGEKTILPLSVQTHHALMDGIHIGKFYLNLQQYLDDPAPFLK